MSHLSLADAQRLNAALVPLYADPRAHLLERLSTAVSSLVGAEITCFDTFDVAGRMVNLGSSAPALFTPETFSCLAEQVHEHPLFGKIFLERSPTPLKITDFCPSWQFFKSDIFNSFYRLLAVRHQLIVGFDLPGVGFTTCALSRSHRDFNEADRALLAFAQAHLAALLHLAHPPASGPADAAALANTLGLTAREADILRHLAQGRADKEIAHCCRISPRTVQNHLRSIYAKLGVDNRRRQPAGRGCGLRGPARGPFWAGWHQLGGSGRWARCTFEAVC